MQFLHLYKKFVPNFRYEKYKQQWVSIEYTLFITSVIVFDNEKSYNLEMFQNFYCEIYAKIVNRNFLKIVFTK